MKDAEKKSKLSEPQQRASVGEKRRENKAVKMACIRGWLTFSKFKSSRVDTLKSQGMLVPVEAFAVRHKANKGGTTSNSSFRFFEGAIFLLLKESRRK